VDAFHCHQAIDIKEILLQFYPLSTLPLWSNRQFIDTGQAIHRAGARVKAQGCRRASSLRSAGMPAEKRDRQINTVSMALVRTGIFVFSAGLSCRHAKSL